MGTKQGEGQERTQDLELRPRVTPNRCHALLSHKSWKQVSVEERLQVERCLYGVTSEQSGVRLLSLPSLIPLPPQTKATCGARLGFLILRTKFKD